MASTERGLALIEETAAGRLVARAEGALRDAGSPSPRLDAELLVAHAFERDRAWLRAHPEAPLDGAARARLDAWIDRRAAGEPIAYIRGFKEWLSLRLLVDRRSLIPRPETELLAELAMAEIADRLVRDTRRITAWEVATGSGAVTAAIALRFRTALSLGRLILTASDISPDALELAAENFARLGVAGLVALAGGDLLEPAASAPPLDVVIANLPYVRSAEVAAATGSLAWEPHLALDGGPDGLSVVRRLVAQLPSRLAGDGVALLEIGAGQAEPIRALLAGSVPSLQVSFHPDLAGHDRVVRLARERA